MTYRVVIYKYGIDGAEEEPDRIVGTGMTESKADRVERGVLRNLDTNRFCVATEREEGCLTIWGIYDPEIISRPRINAREVRHLRREMAWGCHAQLPKGHRQVFLSERLALDAEYERAQGSHKSACETLERATKHLAATAKRWHDKYGEERSI